MMSIDKPESVAMVFWPVFSCVPPPSSSLSPLLQSPEFLTLYLEAKVPGDGFGGYM